MENETILDAIDDIRVPGNPFDEPSNEFWALLCYAHGLEQLYQYISPIEANICEALGPKAERICSTANAIGLSPQIQQLVTCAFSWYSVTAVNFARIIGMKKHSAIVDPKKRKAAIDGYCKDVSLPIYRYRNKVGAHLSWSTHHPSDNKADLVASSLPQLSFVNRRLRVGAWSVTIGRPSGPETSGIEEWSLTEEHERLAQRYWPNRPPPPFPIVGES